MNQVRARRRGFLFFLALCQATLVHALVPSLTLPARAAGRNAATWEPPGFPGHPGPRVDCSDDDRGRGSTDRTDRCRAFFAGLEATPRRSRFVVVPPRPFEATTPGPSGGLVPSDRDPIEFVSTSTTTRRPSPRAGFGRFRC